MLKPQTVVDRKKIVTKLRKVFAGINEKNPYAGMGEDEIMEVANRIVGEVRADRKAKKKFRKS